MVQPNSFFHAVQWLRQELPEGRSLPEQVWRRRHRGFLVFLLAHALVLTILSSVTGHTVMVSLGVGTWITLFALLGTVPRWSRKLRASWVSLGLVTSSALLVHLSGGYIEMHFHYFVMVAVLALYQDWTPFLLAIGYVLFQHGVGGFFFPHTVYNHPDAWAHPWKWAFIHAAFLSSVCVGVIIAWRANESSRTNIENLLNSSTEGFLGLDLQGRVVFANHAIEELTGYSVSELTGRSIDVLFLDSLKPGPSGSPQNLFAIQRALASPNEAYVGEAMLRHRGGRRRIVECRTSPLRDRMELSGIVLTLTDITERKQAEESIRAKEEQFRSVAQSASDAIVSADSKGDIVFWNRGAQTIFGYREEEVLGKPLTRLMPERYREGHLRGLERMRAGGETRVIGKTVELHGLRKDGTEFPLELSLATWRVGENTFYSGILRDITERKRAEEALKEFSEFNQQIIADAQEGIIVYDRHLRYAVWNPFMEELTGLSAEKVLGKHPLDLFPFLREQGVYPLLERALAGERAEMSDVQYSVPHTGRTGWVSVRYGPLRDTRGKIIGVIGMVSDVTARKQAEEELRRSEEQLRQSQKMEAVGSLAGGIAHDFNNLLTVINGYSHLLLDQLGQGARMRSEIEQIRQAGERATSLTQQLLAFSRKQVLTPEVVDLNTVVAGMVEMLQRLLREDIHLVIRAGPALGMVKADRGQIEQVIMNLAVNARDAMPQGGQLTIETANVDVDKAEAGRLMTLPAGAYVMLVVSDTGCGMDADTQARIFEPFFTTKEQGKGTGLGLSTVYGIINQSRGTILVSSEPGGGATFTIYLPRVDETAKTTEPGPLVASLPHGPETVLVVEDEDMVRILLRNVLHAHGYVVLEARDGHEALRFCQGYAGSIQLLITDVVMPGINGRELAERVAPLKPDMKVLFISGHIDDAVVRRGVTECNAAFLQKPIKPASLIRKVREVLQGP